VKHKAGLPGQLENDQEIAVSDNPPASPTSIPDSNSPIFLAMRDIAKAATPDDIVGALRQHVLPGMDRISLARIERDATGKEIARTVSVWDRDGVAPDVEFPRDVQELIDDQPLVVIDTVYLDEFLAPLKNYAVDLLKATSFGIFPLQLGRQTVGFLIVAARKTLMQDDQEVRALLMLGWQIAAMLRSQNLTERLNAQVEQEAKITDLCLAINRAVSYDALGQTLSAALGNFFTLEHLSLTFRPVGSEEASVMIWHGAQLANHAMLTGSLTDQVLKSGETAFLDGIGGPSDTEPGSKGGVQKLLLIPMGDRQEWLGTLNIGIAAGTYFGADERRLCEIAARQVSAAMTNIRLVEPLQRSLAETTTLYTASLALTAAVSSDEVYSTTLSHVAQLSQADRITLYVAGPDPREAVNYVEAVAVWKNDKLVIPSGLRYPLEEAPVLAQFPQSTSNLIFNDVGQDVRLPDNLRQYYADEGVTALMMIPLSIGAIWLGALLIEAHKGRTFTDDQSRLCRSLADQTALALDLQLLLTRTRQAIAREHSLRDITDRIRRAGTIEQIMAITNEELSRILGVGSEKFDQLSMTDSARMALTQTEREFVENVTAQVSLAIENLQLLESTRKAAQTEQTIGNMTVELQRANVMSDVMETAVRSLHGTLGDYDVRIRLLAPRSEPPRLGSGVHLEETAQQDDHPKKKRKRKSSTGILPSD
jgi:GAF domain-containing protein